jgi:hypothetical protein
MKSRVDGINRKVDDSTHEDKFFHELGTTSTELRQAFASQVGISAQRLQLLMRLRWQGETSHSDLTTAKEQP